MRIILGNKPGVEVARHELGVRQQRRLEGDVAGDAPDHKAIERRAHFGNCVHAVCTVHDQLGDHGVVVHGDFTAVLHTGVYAHAQQIRRIALEHGLRRRRKANQATGGRQKITKRVFGVDAALHGPAIALHLRLRERESLAGGHADHQLHQIQAGNSFGHRVLDLQAGVHLQKVKALVFTDHELHRACALVIHGLGQRDGLLAHGFAGGVADEGRRRFLDHLLVAALD